MWGNKNSPNKQPAAAIQSCVEVARPLAVGVAVCDGSTVSGKLDTLDRYTAMILNRVTDIHGTVTPNGEPPSCEIPNIAGPLLDQLEVLIQRLDYAISKLDSIQSALG